MAELINLMATETEEVMLVYRDLVCGNSPYRIRRGATRIITDIPFGYYGSTEFITDGEQTEEGLRVFVEVSPLRLQRTYLSR